MGVEALARWRHPHRGVLSPDAFLPIAEDLVPTPTGWDTAAKTGAGQREEIVLLLVGSALGEAFGWANQQDGRIVHDVCPAPGMERSLTSARKDSPWLRSCIIPPTPISS